jgi:hypothetical protein
MLNLQRSPEDWLRRQRRVKATGWIVVVAVLLVALLSLVATGGRVDLVLVVLLAVTAGCILLMRNLYLWMGLMVGAIEHEKRRK